MILTHFLIQKSVGGGGVCAKYPQSRHTFNLTAADKVQRLMEAGANFFGNFESQLSEGVRYALDGDESR